MGQEIKIRKNPENKNPEILPRTTLGIFENLDNFHFVNENPQKIRKKLTEKKKKFIKKKIRKNQKSENRKSSQKIFHFLKDFHSLTPAGVPFPLEQSLILLGRIHALGHLSNNKELVHFHSQPTTKY